MPIQSLPQPSPLGFGDYPPGFARHEPPALPSRAPAVSRQNAPRIIASRVLFPDNQNVPRIASRILFPPLT
jgi:hypothetical protein